MAATTVEVLNTDAEGRMVLGDCIALASEIKPDAIVDIATLTGAQVVALANTAAVMGNDDDFRTRVLDAAAAVGEAMWPMPLPTELRPGSTRSTPTSRTRAAPRAAC